MADSSSFSSAEFGKAAFKMLVQEFSRQVDSIAERQAAYEVSWEEAILEISLLIQQLRLDAKNLGLFEDNSFDADLYGRN